jgi:Mg-chelatase subunit ChlD
MIRATCSLFALASLALAQAPIASVPIRVKPIDSDKPVVTAMKSSRAIDLVICLDISGSMSGLINAARQNLWSIVNDMATLKPQPELRVALLTYGSPAYGAETGFVSIQSELTTDLDLVSQKLFALSTNGGSEYVARAVKRSVDDLKWSSDPRALKLIFVAGNEAATQDPEFDAMQMASMAIGKGILVNTIYCGSPQQAEAEGWRQVARMADGKFVAIEQNQIAVIETPFDKELMALSSQVNTTYLTFGANRTAWAANQVAQDSNALTLNTAAAAQRCQTKVSSFYFNPANDLCDAVKDPKFDLAAVKKEELPEALRRLTTVQLTAHVATMQAKRGTIQKQVAEIGRKRDAYVKEERRKQSKGGKTMFEDAILESVREQARSRGFERRPEPAVETLKVESPTVELPKGVIVAPVVEVPAIPVVAPPVVQPPKTQVVKPKAVQQTVKKKAKQVPVDMRIEKIIERNVETANGRRRGLH